MDLRRFTVNQSTTMAVPTSSNPAAQLDLLTVTCSGIDLWKKEPCFRNNDSSKISNSIGRKPVKQLGTRSFRFHLLESNFGSKVS